MSGDGDESTTWLGNGQFGLRDVLKNLSSPCRQLCQCQFGLRDVLKNPSSPCRQLGQSPEILPGFIGIRNKFGNKLLLCTGAVILMILMTFCIHVSHVEVTSCHI